jgi:hypothetical protein
VGKRARSAADPMVVDLREALKDLARSLFDPYRPELHYMRGPGPKWHAKHDRAPAAGPSMAGFFAGPWMEHGKRALEYMVTKHPTIFVRLVASLIPPTFRV